MDNVFVIMLETVEGNEMSNELIKDHIDHLRRLDETGQLILCGPFTDYPAGMVIVSAENKEQAEEIAKADPFVKKNAKTYKVHTWQLANKENNYLG